LLGELTAKKETSGGHWEEGRSRATTKGRGSEHIGGKSAQKKKKKKKKNVAETEKENRLEGGLFERFCVNMEGATTLQGDLHGRRKEQGKGRKTSKKEDFFGEKQMYRLESKGQRQKSSAARQKKGYWKRKTIGDRKKPIVSKRGRESFEKTTHLSENGTREIDPLSAGEPF